jgi:hypothetical protein
MQGVDSGDGEVSITSTGADNVLDGGDPFAGTGGMAPDDGDGYELLETGEADEYLSGYTDPETEPPDEVPGYTSPGLSVPTGGATGVQAAAVGAVVVALVLVAFAAGGR